MGKSILCYSNLLVSRLSLQSSDKPVLWQVGKQQVCRCFNWKRLILILKGWCFKSVLAGNSGSLFLLPENFNVAATTPSGAMKHLWGNKWIFYLSVKHIVCVSKVWNRCCKAFTLCKVTFASYQSSAYLVWFWCLPASNCLAVDLLEISMTANFNHSGKLWK